MRGFLILAAAVLALASCGPGAPHEYPAEARAEFNASCPPASDVCVCTWDKITRAMPYEEYETALATFRERGIMDTRLTRARTQCLEQHDN